MYLKQQLAAVFDQLKAKDTQLSAMHQQLQAQHAQQTQRAQQAQQAQHAQHAKHGQQLEEGQQTSQATSPQAADYGSSYFPPSHQSPSGRTSPASVPVTSLQSCPNSTALPSGGASTTVQPQLQIVTASNPDSMEAADSGTPRHRFVKQRVQELQSRQSSPEKSLSSVSNRLNSPRTGLLGSSSTFRAGLLEGALDGSILEAAGSSPGRAGQSSSASKAVEGEAETVAVCSTAGKRSNASEFTTSAVSTSQQQGSSLHSIFRSSDPGMMRQQARRITCASDMSDRAAASSAADEQSRSSSPPQDRAGTTAALQRISPRHQINAQISSSSLQLPSGALPTGIGGSGMDPLPWGGGLEVGSPGMELPSDDDSDLDSSSGEKGTTEDFLVARADMRGAKAVEREDSAQFGPKASAMSLPGRHHTAHVQKSSIADHLLVSALSSAMLCYAMPCYAALCCILVCYAVLCCAVLCHAVLC